MDFPTLPTPNGVSREDSSKFGVSYEDVGLRSEMEGGYVITRPRHTRRPRRTFTTGFTSVSQDNYNTFASFFNQVGTYEGFTYTVRTSNELVNVRFASVPSFKYVGYGTTFMWDIDDIKLEEV